MRLFRFITGYIVGIAVFGCLIPVIFVLISRSLDRLFNVSLTDNLTLRLIVALPIFILGLIFAIWSNVSLFIAGKGGPTDAFGVAVSPRTRHLVITGPYMYSRNPMVFGMMCVYLSIGIFLNSLACLIGWLMLVIFVIGFLIRTEEKRLLKDFGEEFINYKRRVPMILPWPSKSKN